MVLVAAAVFAGCTSDLRIAEQVVREYNEAVIVAYRSQDFGPLRRVAAEKEGGRVSVMIDLKAATGVALQSELQRLTVTKVERGDDRKLVAWTEERWRYFDRSLRPGVPDGPVAVVDMTLTYELVQGDGRWKVERVRALTSADVERVGSSPDITGRPRHVDGGGR